MTTASGDLRVRATGTFPVKGSYDMTKKTQT